MSDKNYDNYHGHKTRAKQSKVEFLLTFNEWLQIWLDSGHLHERGCHKGQYVMARFGDQGPYAVGNVKIIKAEENCSEGNKGKIVSKKTRRLISQAKTGKRRAPFTQEHRNNISIAGTKQVQSDETRKKRSESIALWWGSRSEEERKLAGAYMARGRKQAGV